MVKRTMASLSYGLSTPQDLIEKLSRDGAKLSPEPNPDDVFNFLVTAAAVYEWILAAFSEHSLMIAIADSLKQGSWESMPEQVAKWIPDQSCIPNTHFDVRRHIFNVLRICRFGAAASKHFYWQGNVKAIEPQPIVSNWYQYFFTSTRRDLYIDQDGEVYGLTQVRDIILQFYNGLLNHVRGADLKA